MFEIDYRTTIHRPIEEVFHRLVAIDNYAEWLPKSRIFLDCCMTSPGPVEAGTTFIDRTRIGRFRGEVVELERPTRVVFHNHLAILGVRVMESWPGYDLSPAGEGTRVHHFGEGRAHGAFRLLESYMARRASEERSRTLRFLKRSLEEGTDGPPRPPP